MELQHLYEIERVKEPAHVIVAYLTDRLGSVANKRKSMQLPAIMLRWARNPLDCLIVANAALNDNILIPRPGHSGTLCLHQMVKTHLAH